jgi:hypothetical protein
MLGSTDVCIQGSNIRKPEVVMAMFDTASEVYQRKL